MTIRDHINLIENRYLSLRDQKQEVLDCLDRLLGNQDGPKSGKIAALREVAEAAKRMADNIERHLRDQQRNEDEARQLR